MSLSTEVTPINEVMDRLMASDNDRLQLAKELLKNSDLYMKSEITDSEVLMITRLKFLGLVYKIPEIELWIDNFLQLRVSKRRKGREEYIKSVQLPEMPLMSGPQGILRRI